MMTVWGSILGVVFAVFAEHHDWSNWRLGWNIRLLTVAVAVGLLNLDQCIILVVTKFYEIIEQGILGSGMMFTLIAWTVRMRGPLFVSVFNPLLLVMVSIAGSLFLQEKLHLGMYVFFLWFLFYSNLVFHNVYDGRVLGGVLIIGGLYVVLWGKSKELKKVTQLMPENQVEIDVQFPPPPSRQSSSSHGGGNAMKEEEVEREEEDRDSQAGEVLGSLFMYHYP